MIRAIGPGKLKPARLLPWLLAVFVCRAIVPVGYMPASLAEGGPFSLCDGAGRQELAHLQLSLAPGANTPAAEISDTDHSSHGGGSHGEAHEVQWELCPLGVGAADVPFTFNLDLDIARIAPGFAATVPHSRSGRDFLAVYRARAPPA